MTASYPTSVKTFTTKADNTDYYQAGHINDLQNEVVAIQTELGTDPAGASTDVKARLVAIETDVAAITSNIFLSAAGAVPKTTAGCAAAATSEMSTNKQNVKTLDFDAATEEHADFTFALPSDYDGGTMTAKFYWMHASTTTNFGVVWGIEGRCFGDDEAFDQAVGTAQTVTDTGGTTTDVYISAATSAVTWAGTPAAGELINLTVYRKAADGSDTLAVDAKLIGVLLTYTRA